MADKNIKDTLKKISEEIELLREQAIKKRLALLLVFCRRNISPNWILK
jgi:hypothetical protein